MGAAEKKLIKALDFAKQLKEEDPQKPWNACLSRAIKAYLSAKEAKSLSNKPFFLIKGGKLK